MWSAALYIPTFVMAVLVLTNAATIPLFTDNGNYTTRCKANGGIIAIAIDSSGSICVESFAAVKKFTEYFVTNILASATAVDISVINFSNEADLVETFSKNSTASYVSHMLSKLSHKGQGTNTHKALEFMKKNIFHNSSANNIPQIAVIVTDGSSHNPQLTREYAEMLKVMGVEIYAIGLGNDVNVVELEVISSDPDFEYVYLINDVNNVPMSMEALASLTSLICTVTSTISTTTEQPKITVSTTKITSPTTTASCVAKIADVVFVIDSSGSIGAENFQKLKEFMKNVVRTFDIDSRYTRVAVIKYNDYPNVEFKLNNHTNLNELLAAIDGINYTIGGTNTADALQLMRLEGFDRERPAAPNIGIVITDGLSKYPSLTKAQAELAKNDGITLFAIGIGNETEQEELKNIASGDRVYHVEGFDALETINSAVAHTTCGVNLNESFVTRSTTSPRTTPSGCADYDDNCGSYGRDSCYDYEPFARGHCPKSCGFCRDDNANVTKVCADAVDNCAQYGVEMCYKESQHDWVEANCPKFCGFCGDKHAPLPTTPITTIATSTEALCKDSIPNCNEYGGPGMCQTYGQWARQNCAKYCGVCFNYIYVTASTVGNKKCPAWKLPEACTLEHIQGQCCPSPKCPDGFILTVYRH
ncbi:hypothetical protein CHS0354_032596 [Potamilus streckersoni]|uniref:COL6A n=1 Tax=Potamilus streckersoni TaxID=2493646 RepID=A0AAE0T962_9BIVA|nr:hypothetical protein CHS0354_032596 [Potamilus streckersoni]